MNKDLQILKKHYGEKFSHLCRELFPTLLEEEGLLSKLIEDNFAHSKFLYEDIENTLYGKEIFKDYIYGLVGIKDKIKVTTDKTPHELLSEAGYDLYECKTETDIQSFKKYYAKGEELCTFKGGRLDKCYVFFAVKKNVDEIRREDFDKPERQDLYGTSVISIQFSKDVHNILSIKNRYNHTVHNPDSTFGNDLDNIIPGLTESFEREYNYDLENSKNNFVISSYIKANDGKFYKYNYEVDFVYYCPNNIVIDNFTPIQLKGRYIMMDYFIFDLKRKKVDTDLPYSPTKDGFITSINNIIKNKKNVKVETNLDEQKNKIINIYVNNEDEPINIKLDKYGRIVSYTNKYIKKIDNYFLCSNHTMEELNLENVVEIGNMFLYYNNKIKSLSLPKAKKIGNEFIANNLHIENIDLPNVRRIGNRFMSYCERIETISLPEVRYIGDWFMTHNHDLKNMYVPSIKYLAKMPIDKVIIEIKTSAIPVIPKFNHTNVLDINSIHNLKINFIDMLDKKFKISRYKEKIDDNKVKRLIRK